MNQPHRFIIREEGDPVIVCGPRRSNNEGPEGNVVSRVKAIIDRSDPKRLLVTFSGLVFEGQEAGVDKQEAQHGDEGKDIHSMIRGREVREDVALSSNADEMEICSLYEEDL